jgi:hypothetical protein
MPFMFTIDIRTIYRGLNSLFLFKSVPFLLLSRSFLAHSFGTSSTFIPTILFILRTAPSRFRRFLYIYYTWGNIVNHVFKDLWKTKAPNSTSVVLASPAMQQYTGPRRGAPLGDLQGPSWWPPSPGDPAPPALH